MKTIKDRKGIAAGKALKVETTDAVVSASVGAFGSNVQTAPAPGVRVEFFNGRPNRVLREGRETWRASRDLSRLPYREAHAAASDYWRFAFGRMIAIHTNNRERHP